MLLNSRNKQTYAPYLEAWGSEVLESRYWRFLLRPRPLVTHRKAGFGELAPGDQTKQKLVKGLLSGDKICEKT